VPSKIEWTTETWNPVTGCTKLSPGCDNCYAERIASSSFKDGFDLTFHPERLEYPLHWRKPKKIFVVSMGDLFHSKVPVEFIDSVLDVIRRTPQHSYQILTKRCRRMREYFTLREVPFNAWLGISVERQDFDWRLDYLRQIKAEIRWLSCGCLFS